MPRSSGRRTDYEWANFGDVHLAQDLGAGQAIFSSTALGFNVAGTIMRCRGRVGVILDTGGVDENAIILCGLMVGNSDLIAATTPAPELFTTGTDEARWLWQGQLYVNSGAEAAVIPDFLSATIELDTKAMARVKPGQSLAFVYEAPAALVTDQAGTFDISYFVHSLLGR